MHFHPTYPLFASSSDDGSIQVFHARVYNDLMTNPLIVPLKILRGHAVADGLGVFAVRWVPRQPWLVSAGAGGKGRSVKSRGFDGDMPVIGFGRKNPNERRRKK